MPKRAREDVADCSICCEPLQHDTPMTVQMLCCFQILHICCVQKWERNTRFRTCALCRSEQESHRSQREVDDLVKKACDFQLAEAGTLEKKAKQRQAEVLNREFLRVASLPSCPHDVAPACDCLTFGNNFNQWPNTQTFVWDPHCVDDAGVMLAAWRPRWTCKLCKLGLTRACVWLGVRCGRPICPTHGPCTLFVQFRRRTGKVPRRFFGCVSSDCFRHSVPRLNEECATIPVDERVEAEALRVAFEHRHMNRSNELPSA